MGEIVFLLFLMAVGGMYYHETLGYTVTRFERTGGAAVFPKMLLVALAVVIVLRIVQVLLSRQRVPFKVFTIFRGSRGVFFLSFAGYVFLMNFLGFVISSAAFMAGTSTYMQYKSSDDGTPVRWRRVAARTLALIALSVVLEYFFTHFLHVRIPRGLLRNL